MWLVVSVLQEEVTFWPAAAKVFLSVCRSPQPSGSTCWRGSLQRAVYSAQCTVHSAQCTVHTVHTALHCTALHCTALHCAHCTARSVSVQCAVCIVNCALCSVQCAVCSVQCTVCSVQCTVCSWLPGPLVGGAWLSLPASNPIPPLDYLQP